MESTLIILAVLLAVFGTLSIALIIYIIVSRRCLHINRSRGSTTDTIFNNNNLSRVGTQAVAIGTPLVPYNTKDASTSTEDDPTPSAILRSKQPDHSFRYGRQTMDVFRPANTFRTTSRNCMGIMSAAQHCYEVLPFDQKPATDRYRVLSIIDDRFSVQEELIVPEIRELRVVNLQKTPVLASAQVSPKSEIRPKTFYDEFGGRASKSNQSGVDVSRGMFISQTIGKNGAGGVLDLYGVRLEIPAGALTTENKIGLGVLWTSDHQPTLRDSDAMISPVICCEPHGLLLKKSVTLTIPHCAINVEKDWKVVGWCSESVATSKPTWVHTAKDMFTVTRRHLVFKLSHFTLYTATGVPITSLSEKWVDLVAFASPLTGKMFPIRVYCLNDYTDDEAKDKKKMLEAETRQNGKEVTSPETVAFANNGKNLCLEMDQIQKPWNLSSVCSMKEEIAFQKVWQNVGASCKFVLEAQKKEPSVVCSILGYQADQSAKEKLVINQEREEQSDDRINPDQLSAVFPLELQKIIQGLLDPDQPILHNNWQKLGSNMGIQLKEILFLEEDYRNRHRSPTLYLLNEWVKKERTLEEFKQVMVTIERNDVVDDITTWQSEHAS